jgi:acyl-CoA thioesterase FadM
VKLGTKSITFRVRGRQDGKLCFEGLFTSVFIIADAFKSQPVPPEFRQVIEQQMVAG